MRLRRGADGFTLVELLVAIVILGIISVPLSNVVIGYFRNTDATTARLLESHDAQISSTYWAQDVASIGTRSTTAPYPLNQSVWTGAFGPYYVCPTAGTPLVSLAWDDFTSAGTSTLIQVVYVMQTVSGQTELHRVRCQGSAAVVSDVTLAHYLDPSTPPTVACFGTSGNCAAAGPDVPKSVTLTLTIRNPKNLGAAYVVTLTGQRRQS